MSDLISRQGMVEAIDKHIDTFDAIDANYLDGLRTAMSLLNDLPSAQPDISDDGTLMITVPNGMLNDVKRVLVDEVGTKNCKVMYQDEPERKKGRWIKISPANIYECSECGKNVMTDDISAYDFCHGCGAEMIGEPMDDLISRQAAIDICANAIDLWHGQIGEGALVAVRDKIAELTPAEPKEGRWIEISSITHTYKCSVCGRLLVNVADGRNNVSKHYPYCHCGADMRGERNEKVCRYNGNRNPE